MYFIRLQGCPDIAGLTSTVVHVSGISVHYRNRNTAFSGRVYYKSLPMFAKFGTWYHMHIENTHTKFENNCLDSFLIVAG